MSEDIFLIAMVNMDAWGGVHDTPELWYGYFTSEADAQRKADAINEAEMGAFNSEADEYNQVETKEDWKYMAIRDNGYFRVKRVKPASAS